MHDYETPGIELSSTLIYVLLIFVSVVIAVMGSILLMRFSTRRKIDVKEEVVYRRNVGIALVLGSYIWTLGRMCLESVSPIMNTWYIHYASGFNLKSAMAFTFGIVGALLNALFIGAITIFLALRLLMFLTRDIDEWEEIKRGNVAVAVVISVTVVVVGSFFESVISYIVTTIFSIGTGP